MTIDRWLVGMCALGLLACGSSNNPGVDGGDTGADASANGADAKVDSPDANVPTPDARPAFNCNNQPTLPLSHTSLTGFTGSEDFAFDADGNLVSTDFNGNLTRQPKSGSRGLFVPNVGETAGTRFLPNGDLVVANVGQGSLVRVASTGSASTVLSGIAYPNGVEVDQDGFVYVAEHDAGNVRRINPDNGEFDIIGNGMLNPNGVSFSPDYKTLYVGSFGGGVVYSITRDGSGGWGAVTEFGRVASTDGGGGGGGGGWKEGGGLDGLTVDTCGYVYVTEFIFGKIWRFAPTGGDPQLVAELPSSWIPNLHWGTGTHGWERDVLYVMDRDQGRVFELPLTIPEKDTVYP